MRLFNSKNGKEFEARQAGQNSDEFFEYTRYVRYTRSIVPTYLPDWERTAELVWQLVHPSADSAEDVLRAKKQFIEKFEPILSQRIINELWILAGGDGEELQNLFDNQLRKK